MKNIEIGTGVTDIGGDIYVIKEQIGAGGFAIVYRAERSDDKLDYAIKVATGNDKSVLGSMKNEYEAASKIHSLHSIEYLYFNLRKMEIEERIYKPLLNVVKDYNDSIVSDGMILEQMEYNIEEETISFKFIDKMQEDCEDRSIDFDFWLVHDTEDNRSMRRIINSSTSFYDNYETAPVSYHYFNKKILLWGTVKADCGVGFSIAITENKEDPNYGDLMCVTKTKNDGTANSYAISEMDLQKYCRRNFSDMNFTIKFSDFNFECIEQLIKTNSVFKVNSFYEPTSINLLLE